MASSPSDTAGNRNVIQWLERLQQSVHNQPASSEGGARAAFKIDTSAAKRKGAGAVRGGMGGFRNADGDEESDEEFSGNAEVGVVVEDTGAGFDTDLGELRDAGSPSQGAEDEEGARGEGYNYVVSETLGQNDALPDDPIKLIARLSLTNQPPKRRARSKSGRGASAGAGSGEGMEGSGKESVTGLEEDENDNDIGPANETYFLKGPASDLEVRKALIERHSPPEILVHGLVTAEDVDRLFDIFYEKVNPFLSLLDPVLHTPASTFARCPFLFTVVCAIASRFYREKSEIYAIAMHFAKHAASTALIDGWKSVELCQAYILMAVYAVPARRWEEDRSWLYTGLAIRLATDLNLHQPQTGVKPVSEQHERELLNRTRVWMICFNLDRSTATQFGKPSTIKEDYNSIIRNGKDWYKRSKLNHPYDIHLCGYSSLLRIVAEFHDEIFSDKDSPSGLNESADFRSITLRHDEKLEAYHVEWNQRIKEGSDPNVTKADDSWIRPWVQVPQLASSLFRSLVNYSRLVMFSFGFQQAFKRGFQNGDSLFLKKCMDSAQNVVRCVIDSLAPSGYFKYAPDGHFVFASFASAFLLKLLRPEFENLVSKDNSSQILSLIGKLIQVLASSEVAIDDRHTPKLYARFLAGLLAKHQPGGPSSGRLHTRQHPPEGHTPDSDGSYGYGQYGGMGSGQGMFHVGGGGGGGSSTGTSPHGGSTSQRQLSGETTPDMQVHQQLQQQSSPLSSGSTPMESTPIYEAEATYVGSGPLELTSADAGLSGMGFGVSDEEMLATMQALQSPAWWQDMLMPGFSWPEANRNVKTNGYHHQANGFDFGQATMPQGMVMTN
ncbi:hypothetical protein SCHPADRAFT_896598 [Schizopora paradoxa]|uniref:Xylanolytic transcriptional activator regulatory domain-containing protein n=1 Tax=Schizopora paradoxa TaxID=27342 RepID=A0A0H2R161_9AGAM|nr:hypothetical protein SCHPADRAFT_896598 [Schizopora paradoxa]